MRHDSLDCNVLIRVPIIALLACVVLSGLLLVQGQAELADVRAGAGESRHQLDFAAQFTGARLVALGRVRDLYDVSAQRAIQQTFYRSADDPNGIATYVLPPPLALLLAPLAAGLSFAPAYATFAALNLLLLVGVVVWLLLRLGLGPWPTGVLALAAIGYHPVWLTLSQGQTGVLVLVVWVAAWAALRHGQAGLGGAWIGLLAFKPPLLIVPALALILARPFNVRTAFGMAASAGALLAVSLLLLGPPGIADGVRVATERSQWTATSLTGPGEGWAGQFERWLGAGSVWLWPAALLGCCAASLLASRSLGTALNVAEPQAFSLLVVLSYAGAPYGHSYDQAVLVLPGLLLASFWLGQPGGPWRSVMLGLLALCYLGAWLTPVPAALPSEWDVNVLLLSVLVGCVLLGNRSGAGLRVGQRRPIGEPS